MKKVFVSEMEYRILSKIKHKKIKNATAKFSKRKKIHLNNIRLQEFFSLCEPEFHPLLYTIPFRCYFSFYLYLYLKKHIERLEGDLGQFQFTISKPIEINFSDISRRAGISINTVKSAFAELKKFQFLKYSELLTDSKQNACKSAILINDYFLIGYDELQKKTFFTLK